MFDVPPECEGLRVVRCVALFVCPISEREEREGKPVVGKGLAVMPVPGEEGVYRRMGLIWGLRMR